MDFPKLYLRNEYTKTLDRGFTVVVKVVAYYKDAEMSYCLCKNPWPSAPDRRFKRVFFNCAKHDIVWLEDYHEDKTK